MRSGWSYLSLPRNETNAGLKNPFSAKSSPKALLHTIDAEIRPVGETDHSTEKNLGERIFKSLRSFRPCPKDPSSSFFQFRIFCFDEMGGH